MCEHLDSSWFASGPLVTFAVERQVWAMLIVEVINPLVQETRSGRAAVRCQYGCHEVGPDFCGVSRCADGVFFFYFFFFGSRMGTTLVLSVMGHTMMRMLESASLILFDVSFFSQMQAG